MIWQNRIPTFAALKDQGTEEMKTQHKSIRYKKNGNI